MKKYGVLILAILMIFSSCAVFAEGTFEDYENAVGNKISIDANTFVESGTENPNTYYGQSSKTEYMSSNKTVMVFSGADAMFGYDVEIAKSGTYEVVAYIASTSKMTVSLLLNGEEKGRGSLNAQPSYSHYMPVNLGTLDLEEGTNRIGVKNYSGEGSQFVYLTVEFVAGNLETSAIFANETKIDETLEISSSTDAFTIFFNHKINKETAEGIKLNKKDGEEVDAEIKVFDKKAEINLKESLSEETEYTISVGFAEDFMSKSRVENLSFDVKAVSGSKQKDCGISLESVSADYEDITIKGKITSSKGLEIRNKKIFADIGEVSKAQETISDENGEFMMTYSLADDTPSGEVKISVYSDHYEKRTEKNVLYVSKSFEETILSAIENAVSAEEVGNILTENEAELGINIKLDTLPVSDKNIVYIHLAGKSYDTISDLLCAYYSYAAIEDVNYATTARHINAVLSSEKICSVLEIETEKVNALSATNKTDFNKIFIDWPEEFNDVATLKKVFKDTIRIFMMKQYEKSDVSLTEDDFSVYLGEIIEHKICLVDDADDVKSITIRLKADDEKIFDGFDFENKSEFNCETELDDGILALTFEADDALSCEELGILTLRTSETGSYEIIQSGELLYDVGENFLIEGLIEGSVLDVNVQKSKPSKGSGGGSSTSVPSSRPSANDVTQRPIENKEPENKPEKEKYKFSDLENHTWAKEAIDELLKTGIISESEDKKFNPSSNITREEFVKLVVCALGIETEGKTTGFADVASDAWYYEYVAAAENAGVVTGSDGKFGIGTLITREDMATILYRAVSEKLAIGQENELFGDDEVISPYAKEAVYAMRNNKIINGVGDNSFMPKNNATRAESAKMIYELIKVVNS